jgi:hypothetical protein
MFPEKSAVPLEPVVTGPAVIPKGPPLTVTLAPCTFWFAQRMSA